MLREPAERPGPAADPTRPPLAAGLFVTLEGGDGAGKTTLIAALARDLAAVGLRVLTTREPGGTPGAEALRDLLVRGAADRWDPVAEVLLLYAARRDHVRRRILPALGDGQVVLCDRFTDSTLAYQGHGHGVPEPSIAAIRHATLGAFGPDLTLILDVEPALGLERAGGRQDAAAGHEHRFEALGAGFQARLRAGFLAIAAADPGRCRVLDATQPPADLAAQALALVLEAARQGGGTRPDLP